MTLQLNWYHDPSFAGEYAAAASGTPRISVTEGGPNVSPINEVVSGRATAAVVGADIFLEALDKAGPQGLGAQCIFVDFQRNPVGWVVHPKVAERAGLNASVLAQPKALNAWLFTKFLDKTISAGDKRGTETTSVWLQWAKRHNAEQVRVLPVGFDSAIVLTAPTLAYPVYLNEEPFQLSEKIGKPVVVFDPAVDGVELYGNIVIVASSFAAAHPEEVRQLQTRLRNGWISVRADPESNTKRVSTYYKGGNEAVIRSQLNRTTEFVFYSADKPGTMDITDNGKWKQTLVALQEAGLISRNLTLDRIRKEMIMPQQ